MLNSRGYTDAVFEREIGIPSEPRYINITQDSGSETLSYYGNIDVS